MSKPIAPWIVKMAAASAAAILIGCQKPDDASIDAPPVRKTVSFQGKVEPDWVGDWKAPDGSEMNLAKDGSLTLVAISVGPQGSAKKTLNGKWLRDGQNLLLQYGQGSNSVTLQNSATKSGSVLTLIQAGNLHKTVYKLSSG